MESPSKILSIEEMNKPRTPDELFNWVETILCRFRASEEGKKYCRLKIGHSKQFIEEVRPLALLAMNIFGGCSKILCQPVTGNQNYDALIEDRRDDIAMEYKVEFTSALGDGYGEHCRMEVLNEKGHVNAYANVSVSGTKFTGHVTKMDSGVMGRKELIAKAEQLINEGLNKKVSKPYGPMHWLCVVFDDRLWLRNKDDAELVHADASLARRKLTFDFGRVFVLGSSGDLLWELI